jgi:hypothetical protein
MQSLLPSIVGTGLDYEKSQFLRNQMKIIPPPLGPVRVLIDQAARDYHGNVLTLRGVQ